MLLTHILSHTFTSSLYSLFPSVWSLCRGSSFVHSAIFLVSLSTCSSSLLTPKLVVRLDTVQQKYYCSFSFESSHSEDVCLKASFFSLYFSSFTFCGKSRKNIKKTACGKTIRPEVAFSSACGPTFFQFVDPYNFPVAEKFNAI